jgi:hypothetical protein
MATLKTQKKATARPRKVAAKKTRPKKGSLEAAYKAAALLRKHNVDLSFIME